MTERGYHAGFYPMHLGLLSVGENLLPVAWWTPVSKEPFRFHSLDLLRTHREAVMHFFPFERWQSVVRAGYLTGRRVAKAARLGFALRPAEKLHTTRVVDGADAAFELAVAAEIESPPGDHVPFVFDVVHVHRRRRPATARPLLFLGWRDFATLGERARFRP